MSLTTSSRGGLRSDWHYLSEMNFQDEARTLGTGLWMDGCGVSWKSSAAMVFIWLVRQSRRGLAVKVLAVYWLSSTHLLGLMTRSVILPERKTWAKSV